MKINKTFFSFLFCAIISYSLICTNVSADSCGDLKDYYTDNTSGWSLRSSKLHRGTKSCKYKYASDDVKKAFSKDMEGAISLWGSHISMSETTASGYGYIRTENNDGSASIAKTGGMTFVETTGHYNNEFTIIINTALYSKKTDTLKQKVLAHEIGHVYGLDHFSDVNKIMNPSLQATGSITSSEFNGMDTCTHNHTHTATTYYSYSGYSANQHIARCSTCKAYTYQNHVMNGKVCAKCGYPYANSINDYEDFDGQDNDNVEVDDMPQGEFEYEDEITYSDDTPFVYDEN